MYAFCTAVLFGVCSCRGKLPYGGARVPGGVAGAKRGCGRCTVNVNRFTGAVVYGGVRGWQKENPAGSRQGFGRVLAG